MADLGGPRWRGTDELAKREAERREAATDQDYSGDADEDLFDDIDEEELGDDEDDYYE